MNEVKKITVIVKQDTVIFKGVPYEKGKPIADFPYVEKDHKNIVEPEKKACEEPVIAETVKEPEPKEEIKEEPKEKEPVRKGRK